MSAPLLDLLRERRQKLGQESMTSALLDRRPLLLRGALVGAVVLGVAVGCTALVFLRQQVVKAQTAQLTRFEAESNQLQAEMAASKTKLDQLTAINRGLTEALTTLRTSSALLADLQLRTPEGVQITSAEARGTVLVLKGQAVDPLAFARINAMQLELRRSPLMDAKGVNLVKLERVEATAGTAKPDDPVIASAVRFEMTGPFASLPPARQLAVMRQLGSQGMARRLQLLQGEGLIQ
ncbi:PilN domain-containing protein [Synechococcus sp. CCY 9618]|uniref:PilN domain-containing protein n=1 Tax=Synechococcus sp. CCY 9618 TaxID=2815602 RepID=UPI001C2356A9|nr:PilN domain-containing protein [Synechococcus sp. CCY 9618]